MMNMAFGQKSMANGLSQHSQGQRPWNAMDPSNRLANGHIQCHQDARD